MNDIEFNKDYVNLVELKYQLYNGLFLTLPLDAVEQTGLLLPLLEQAAKTGLDAGQSPDQIVREFFKAHKPHFSEHDEIQFLFKIIQYVERQVALVDALEDAAYAQIHKTDKNNVLHQLLDRIRNDGLEDRFHEVLNSFGSRVILTAHPTQFYPGQVLAIINDLAAAVETNDSTAARDLLQQLGNTPFFNKEKPTPYDEAISLTWYLANIFYQAIGELVNQLPIEPRYVGKAGRQLLGVGFWPGGDRDGNPYVDVEITHQVALKLRSLIVSCYHQNIRELKRRLSFKGVYDRLEELEQRLHQELINEADELITVEELLKEIDEISELVAQDYQGLFVKELKSFRHKVCVFGLHFASLDIRQDSRVIKRTFDAVVNANHNLLPKGYDSLTADQQLDALFDISGEVDYAEFEDPTIKDTLASMAVIAKIQQRNGEPGCHRYIISNCRDELDVARVMALFRLVGWPRESLSVDIVPLFETVADLEQAGEHMAKLYSCQGYQAHLHGRENQQTVMLGFSDGTKDGGYLMANWAIYRAKEELTKVSRNNAIEVAFFDGRGGPPARGGGSTYSFYAALGKQIESNQIQVTIQGQTISSYYGNMDAAQHNLRQLLAAGLENNVYDRPERELSEAQRALIEELANDSYAHYLSFKNHDLFIPYLEEMSTLKYYGLTNIGSRPTRRGSGEGIKFDELRAIPFVGAWAQLKQNVPGYFGLGTALHKMEKQGRLKECQALYRQSRFFKALVDNSMQSMSKTNFKLTAYMQQDERFGEFWHLIHDEFCLSRDMALKVSGQSVLLADNATSRLSISLRQQIVLPLLLIQQYALIQVNNIMSAENSDDKNLLLYEKMIVRSLFGNINASRNSA